MVGAALALCLATMMAGEARGEGDQGMLAVADVALNRSEATGLDVCSVVRAPRQFQGFGRVVPTDREVGLAQMALDGLDRGITHGATAFERVGGRASWERSMRLVARIGHHAFYAPR